MGESEDLLLYVAENGGMYSDINISTIQVAKDIKVSQQTISRKLIELENEGLINRLATPRGIKISLTELGREKLIDLQAKLSNIFTKGTSKLKGLVQSGIGEGSYYVSLKPYLKQFKEKLLLDPFIGTLNVKISYSEFIKFISVQKKIRIDGFETSSRTFGPITAYKIRLNDIESAIIIPDRTSHDRTIIEVISKTCFRRKFSLKDGDEVTLTL